MRTDIARVKRRRWSLWTKGDHCPPDECRHCGTNSVAQARVLNRILSKNVNRQTSVPRNSVNREISIFTTRPNLGVTPLKFRAVKTRMMELSDGERIPVIYLAVLVQYPIMEDKWTNRRAFECLIRLVDVINYYCSTEYNTMKHLQVLNDEVRSPYLI